MTSNLTIKLDAILARQDELHALLQTAEASTYVALAKELAEIEPIVARVQGLRAVEAELASIEQLLADPATDAEMRELAQDERQQLKERLPSLERELRLALLPKDAADDKSAILEIRAGTGGEEAALFAGDLLRMYQRYAEAKGWKVELLSESETDLGGYKEVVLAVEGKGVFARLKFEAGVHRVQRVPTTEAGGRIHTSAATVAVLPEADEVDIVLDEKDLKFDVFRASGAGGQHVNRTESAVRVTHIPTGIAIAVQEQRSQHKNKARALAMLRARLYEMEREAKDSSRAADRKGQVGSGDRSERIRTYNFPQNRVTDHRINLTLYALDRLMAAGSLDEIVEPLIADHEAARLAEAE